MFRVFNPREPLSIGSCNSISSYNGLFGGGGRYMFYISLTLAPCRRFIYTQYVFTYIVYRICIHIYARKSWEKSTGNGADEFIQRIKISTASGLVKARLGFIEFVYTLRSSFRRWIIRCYAMPCHASRTTVASPPNLCVSMCFWSEVNRCRRIDTASRRRSLWRIYITHTRSTNLIPIPYLDCVTVSVSVTPHIAAHSDFYWIQIKKMSIFFNSSNSNW